MQYFVNCGALVNIILGMRGRISEGAQGRPWFAMWSLDFMKVMRGPIVLTMLCMHTQDIEEGERLMGMPPILRCRMN